MKKIMISMILLCGILNIKASGFFSFGRLTETNKPTPPLEPRRSSSSELSYNRALSLQENESNVNQVFNIIKKDLNNIEKKNSEDLKQLEIKANDIQDAGKNFNKSSQQTRQNAFSQKLGNIGNKITSGARAIGRVLKKPYDKYQEWKENRQLNGENGSPRNAESVQQTQTESSTKKGNWFTNLFKKKAQSQLQ